jgi:hypothetical protein
MTRHLVSPRRSIILASIIFGILLIASWSIYFAQSSRVILLRSRDGSDWIRVNQPFELIAHVGTTTLAHFRTDIEIPKEFAGAELRVRALRQVVVSLDGNQLFDTGPRVDDWRTIYRIPLSKDVQSGKHELRFRVIDANGPCLMWAYSPKIQLHSDEHWQASLDGITWSPAIGADHESDPELSNRFGPVAGDVLAMSPLLIGLFIVGYSFAARRASKSNWVQRVRWGLLIAWLALAVNNFFKFPASNGYDAILHWEYIHYLGTHLRIPLPNEGAEFFQTPLYYIISAVIYRPMLALGLTPENAIEWLRIIPLTCGLVMVEICYRTARYAFPDRQDLQAIATAVGGLLPMNLYMAQSISNEPFAACFGGGVVCLSFRLLARPSWARTSAAAATCGLFLGLDILSKVSGLLMVAPLCGALVWSLAKQRVPITRILRSLAVLLIVAIGVCGWYFLRNLMSIGTLFYTNAKPSSWSWWQDPGYRTPRQLFEFGHVLLRPVWAVHSVWDSLYSTLWADGFLSGDTNVQRLPPLNYRLMSCGVWLGLMPTILIVMAVVGLFVKSFRRPVESNLQQNQKSNPDPAMLWFSTISIGCFLAAIVYVFLTLPIYSCAKASYMLGLTPCIAVLVASGFGQLNSHRKLRAVAFGWLFCGLIVSYLTYFVV